MKDDFKFLAKHYDQVIHAQSNFMWSEIIDRIESEVLLDVGGGTGRIISQLSDKFISRVVCDYSLPMLRIAKSKGHSYEICCQAEYLPFESNSKKFIIMVESLHHLSEPKMTIFEILRVLAKDGVFIIEEPNIEKWQIKIIALLERIFHMRSHFYSCKEIIDMISMSEIDITPIFKGNNFSLIIKYS